MHPYALPASHASSVDAGRGCGLVRKPGSQLPFAPQVSSHLGDGKQGIVGRHFGHRVCTVKASSGKVMVGLRGPR